MWIRSQDKENLAEANDIDIIDRKKLRSLDLCK